ncbi:MAG TPA: carbonic anhydrase [Terriglobales bacterium]|nr:carbonic anhydrase [Terriglobales bacterium]
MSAIDKAIAANQDFIVNYDPNRVSPRPRLKLIILTCMDTRISYKALGLEPGDVHMIRNAGGIVTDDALRSILVSHYLLGTEELMIINHTDCGLMKASEEELHATIESKAGVWSNTPIRFHAFKDVEKNVREQITKIKSHNWVKSDLTIRGFVYDVATGKLREVKA